jgi:hypothetical protein
MALAAVGLTSTAAAASGAAAPARDVARVTAGRAALARVEAIRSGRLAVPGGDATTAMRDLAFAVGQLSPADRSRAESLLARLDSAAADPRTGGYSVPSTYTCSAHFCVHYVRSTNDAPRLRDGNRNGVPDWVETTISVLESLWQTEVVEYSFRPPESDLQLANHGPDGRLDVYLADLVDDGLLGYCSPERPPGYSHLDATGYCVLDNDYSPAQIAPPGLAGLLELELTAVHEFFHAIQFGYDASDDTWLLEGTATWIEDEVYGTVHEAYARFPYSALRQPQVPLDAVSRTKPYQYGSWVFWRYLEELLAPGGSKRDPAVIRRVWEYADARPGAPDQYSLRAVESTLAEHGLSLRSALRGFAVANLIPRSFYRDGATWPAAPVTRSARLSTARRRSRGALSLDHLSSRYVAFVPARGVKRGARLALALDLPPVVTGTAASVVVFPRRGAPTVVSPRLSLTGKASVTIPFGRDQVTRVVLALVNASDRYRCWTLTSLLSCHGRSLDDGRVFRYAARLRQ